MNRQDALPAIRRHFHDAMATAFEVRIANAEPDYAKRAATEAFRIVDRLEDLLSRFREDSDISRLGRLRDGEALRVADETFDCLRIAVAMQGATGGAFDPALGPDDATETGPRGRLVLYPEDRAVVRDGGPVRLDLGAIGKGYALDRIAAMFAEWEIADALLIAGGSSLLALGGPTPETGWETTLTRSVAIPLRHRAAGVSGAAVKGAHILDPRDRTPYHRHTRTWAVATTAAEADALSTAFMLLEPEDIAAVCAALPGTGAAILDDAADPATPVFYGDFPATHTLLP